MTLPDLPPFLNPSELFGRTDGLEVYKLARSTDKGSERPDQPIEVLAEDAVRTAHRWAYEAECEVPGLEIEVATKALIQALKEEVMPNS